MRGPGWLHWLTQMRPIEPARPSHFTLACHNVRSQSLPGAFTISRCPVWYSAVQAHFHCSGDAEVSLHRYKYRVQYRSEAVNQYHQHHPRAGSSFHPLARLPNSVLEGMLAAPWGRCQHGVTKLRYLFTVRCMAGCYLCRCLCLQRSKLCCRSPCSTAVLQYRGSPGMREARMLLAINKI
jgi:hypothetical protein